MKKFWSLMLVALVTLGAAACTETEESVEKSQEAGLSFSAEIAVDTRAVTEKGEDNVWKTTWTSGDTLMVGEYEFTFDGEKFTCNAEGVNSIVGQEVTITGENGGSDYGDKAYKIAAKTVTFEKNMTVTLESALSFFYFEYPNSVLFNASENIFKLMGEMHDTIEFASVSGKHLFAFYPTGNETTLSYSIGGVKVKETTINFAAGKVYNLGTLTEAVAETEALKDWGIVGAHQGWNTENKDALYLIPGSNTYVKRNVTLMDGGFKFYGTTSKTVTVEHPAVTSGESGDWYLKPNSNWKEANARFAIYFFNDTENIWVSMKDDNGDGVYVANNPNNGKTYTKMIFCRMNPANTTNDWGNKWNQTGDLDIPTNGNNCFSVPSGSWDNSTTGWSVHTPEIKDAWTEEVEEVTTYWVGKESTDDISTWVTRWSNNVGNDNITVSDYTKTYDIYFSLGAEQEWGGFEIYYTVLESGSPAPELK